MIRGLSAFPITPADSRGHIDVDALQTLLERLLDAGVDSIGLLGSTGAYPFFSRDERRHAVAAAADCVRHRVPLLVGVGALRTSDAVALAQDARAEGADFGLLAPVSYTPLLDAEVVEHFRAVAATGLPLCIYNNPGTTHFDISPALATRLAEIPGVVALKTGAPAGDEVAALLAILRGGVPADFSIGFAVDWNAADALLAGADAWYSVMAGVYPQTFQRLARAAMARDAAETRRQHDRLAPLWRLCRDYTSFRLAHLAAGMAGIAHAVPPRPILPLSGDAERDARRVLERLALD